MSGEKILFILYKQLKINIEDKLHSKMGRINEYEFPQENTHMLIILWLCIITLRKLKLKSLWDTAISNRVGKIKENW